jgi:hypothetical protein
VADVRVVGQAVSPANGELQFAARTMDQANLTDMQRVALENRRISLYVHADGS